MKKTQIENADTNRKNESPKTLPGDGILGTPESFLRSLNLSLIPARAAEYLKNEILSDAAIASMTNEEFEPIKNAILDKYPGIVSVPEIEPDPVALEKSELEILLKQKSNVEFLLEDAKGKEKKKLLKMLDNIKFLMEESETTDSEDKGIVENDWTEPPEMNAQDWSRLKVIKKYCDDGAFASAMDYAMSSDTAIRDAVPPDLWLKMGGMLTAAGKEKLKKLQKSRE